MGTFDLRKRTGLAGDPLYLLSGLRVIALDYRDFPASVAFDGAPTERMHPLTFAVQIGPTYGSGFKICPDADPADGMFDICYVSGPMLRLFAPSLLMAAKTGRHVHNRRAHLKRVRSVSLSFEGPGVYPAQADGERIEASRVTASIVPRALTVLAPSL